MKTLSKYIIIVVFCVMSVSCGLFPDYEHDGFQVVQNDAPYQNLYWFDVDESVVGIDTNTYEVKVRISFSGETRFGE